LEDVFVAGCGMTKFGRHDDKNLMDLLIEASNKALEDANVEDNRIDSVYVASMLAGELTHQTCVSAALTDQLGLLPASAQRIENGTASGSSAIINAFLAIASGLYDLVLVTGGEKMRAASGAEITDWISTMAHPTAEYIYGVTLPSLAAMFTRLYMERYGVTRRHLAKVAVKNHENALKNPYAHIHQKITLEGILDSPEAQINNPLISDPIRLYDCCPVTDGAAAVLLCSTKMIKKLSAKPIKISGVGNATGPLAVCERDEPLVLEALKQAAKKAFKMANLEPKDIDFAELHDAFEILELAESEDAGFFEKGTGHKELERGTTSLTGEFPINPSGGLKARGHPVGATGVAQVVEITWQLRSEAGERQVRNAKRGFCCNFAGFASNVSAIILERLENV
jgi:acetyl-CoA C-acetyltransferase